MQLEQNTPRLATGDEKSGRRRKELWLRQAVLLRRARRSLGAWRSRFDERYLFLKGHLFRAAAWPILCTVAAVSACIAVEAGYREERREVETRAFDEANSANRAYSQQIRNSIDNLSQTLAILKYLIENEPGSVNARDKARAVPLQ